MKTIKVGKTMTARKSNERCKAVFGTREWTDYSENFISGCSHDCRYCYAKAREIRFKRKTPQTWKLEEVNKTKLSARFKQLDGKIMFPTSHDITPPHLQECMDFMDHMLLPGNEVLVVSKPHLDCIKAICARFTDYKEKILFRFTITSTDSNILKFWEPNAPDFQERLSALQYAFEQGFQTSISCEPMLDNNMGDLISQTSPFVTDSIWLGKMNMPFERLQMSGENDLVTIAGAYQLIARQTDAYIWGLYFRYKDSPKVKWKESIKKVVGLEIATEPGLDK
jgi:DNA repair photolyase